MVGQILPNNNEKRYSNFSPNFSQLNTPLAQPITAHVGYALWPLSPSPLTSDTRCGHRALLAAPPRHHAEVMCTPKAAHVRGHCVIGTAHGGATAPCTVASGRNEAHGRPIGPLIQAHAWVPNVG
jgi:hypothetical protein